MNAGPRFRGLLIDKDARDVVLHALFSRSEKSLSAKVSGPTMPGILDTA